ncbi:hypothetical protein D3C71_360770 [compost metagenome]
MEQETKAKRPDDVYDDKGRWIRPAFLDRDNHLTIFRDHIGRQRYVDRNKYVLDDGIWKSDGLIDCRDVIVRDGGHNFWEVVPEAEYAALRDRVYGAVHT